MAGSAAPLDRRADRRRRPRRGARGAGMAPDRGASADRGRRACPRTPASRRCSRPCSISSPRRCAGSTSPDQAEDFAWLPEAAALGWPPTGPTVRELAAGHAPRRRTSSPRSCPSTCRSTPGARPPERWSGRPRSGTGSAATIHADRLEEVHDDLRGRPVGADRRRAVVPGTGPDRASLARAGRRRPAPGRRRPLRAPRRPRRARPRPAPAAGRRRRPGRRLRRPGALRLGRDA